MGEFVNEVDAEGKGIRVPATYYVQIGYGNPVQRLVQHKTDDPLQIFYNFATGISGIKEGFSTIGNDLKIAGITGFVKMVSMPLAKNSVLIRLENLSDYLDDG